MKILYFDCGMGAAGDMLTAALLELIPDKEKFVGDFNALGVPNVEISVESASKCGINGTSVRIMVDGAEENEDMHSYGKEGHEHSHHHTLFRDIENIVGQFALNENVKSDILSVYKSIAEAEAYVHNSDIDNIHFHEVGTMDAIADVTAVCMLIDELKIDKICASPVNVGSGAVYCAHGILPVPAPATAYILRNVPIYSDRIDGELCTPTGAALLKYFVDSFGDMPAILTERIGYGMGKKDFAQANCVRAFLGVTADETDEVLELSLNVDDMTAEEIAFACERLFEAGAFEVYSVPINMKKGRPGTLIRIMCSEEKKNDILSAAFKHTSTIGIREIKTHRYILDREIFKKDTEYGTIRYKRSSGYGTAKEKPEYEDIARIAKEQNKSVREIIKCI